MNWELVDEYCENSQAIKDLLAVKGFKAKTKGVIVSPWNADHYALEWEIEVGGQTFEFYGSHNDAMRFKKTGVQPKDILYSWLCCVGGDIRKPLLFEDFCFEFGYDQDSMRAHETWKKSLAYRGKLEKAGFTQEMEYPS